MSRQDRLWGPRNKQNVGPASHPSEIPNVVRVPLPGIAFCTPPGQRIPLGEFEHYIIDPKLSDSEYEDPPSNQLFIIPTVKKPPCHKFRVGHGGVKTGGGGTSKDAIRRARRQEKRRNRKRRK